VRDYGKSSHSVVSLVICLQNTTVDMTAIYRGERNIRIVYGKSGVALNSKTHSDNELSTSDITSL
jgi:hypothetical protein